MTKDVHHQTKRAADMALPKKQISPTQDASAPVGAGRPSKVSKPISVQVMMRLFTVSSSGT
jgi:hypothetical protein